MSDPSGWSIGAFLKITGLSALFLLFPACSGGEPAPDVIRWRAQAGTMANSWLYQDFFTRFAHLVGAKSEGALHVEVFPPGAIVDAYEQFSAVQRGAVEVGMGVGGYNLKQVPEAYIEQGLFGLFSGPEQFIDFYLYYRSGAVYRLLDEAYRERGCHLLKSLGPSPLVLISREPITSLEAIKGLKIRGSGAAPDLITRLGGVPVTLAPSEIFTALQMGTIDAVILPSYTIGTMNLWDVAKGMTGPPFGHLAGDIYVNLDAYDALPAHLRRVVEESAEEAMNHYVAALRSRLKNVLREAGENHGVRLVDLSEKEYQDVLDAAESLLDGAATRSERSARIVDLLRQYRQEAEAGRMPKQETNSPG